MAKLPKAKSAKPKMLEALGYPEREARQLAKSYNRVAARSNEIRKQLEQSGGAEVMVLDHVSPDGVITLAQYAPSGALYAGTVSGDQAATGVSRVPPGLDAAGKALHALIARLAASARVPYFEAMSRVTGNPDYAKLSDVPAATVLSEESDPDRRTQYFAARALAATAGRLVDGRARPARSPALPRRPPGRGRIQLDTVVGHPPAGIATPPVVERGLVSR
jgi:hypothetical protein